MIESEVVPPVDYPLVVHGEGVLEWQGKAVPVVSAIAERLKYRPDRPWNVTLTVGKVGAKDLGTVINGRSPLPVFSGFASDGRPFVIPAIEYTNRRENRLVGEAYELSLGIADAPVVPAELVLTAHLSDNSVALSLQDFLLEHHDGRVTGGKRRPPQAIRSSLGTIKLWRGSRHEPVEIGGVRSSARRSSTIAQVVVPPSKRRQDLSTMVDQLNEELDHLTAILSLCSRQRVGCFRIGVWAHWKEQEGGLIEGERWRYCPSPEDRRAADPLINPGKIGPGGLNKVVKTYRQHPARERLDRAITYTVGAYSQRIIEHHALYAFTALESLVDTLHEDPYTLPEEEFSELTKGLKSSIRGTTGTLQLSKHQRRDLYAKLGELRRRPLIPRIIELVRGSAVEWGDLWPNEGLETALRHAYARRNDLIHQGHLSDPGGTVRDSLRISALSERILMSEMGVPNEWLSPRAYDIFRWLGRD